MKAGRPRNKTAPRFCLGTFRRKNRRGELTRAATLASCSGRFALFQSFISLTGFSSHFGARSAKVFPISIGLSAMTPNPTHRFMPASPRYRQRFNPCRRLTTLIRVVRKYDIQDSSSCDLLQFILVMKTAQYGNCRHAMVVRTVMPLVQEWDLRK